MGLLEIHFHDSEFVFRPSMRVGPSAAEPASGSEDSEDKEVPPSGTGDSLRFPLDEHEGSGKRGLLVGLVLIGVFLLVRKVLQNRETP